MDNWQIARRGRGQPEESGRSKKAQAGSVAPPTPPAKNTHADHEHADGCCQPAPYLRPTGELPAHATPRLSSSEEDYLRKFYDSAGGRGWNYDTYKKNHSQLLGAVSEGWPAKGVSHSYGEEDHLTRANFEADVHVFGHGKTVAQTLQLNTLLKDSKDFESFKAAASKVLTTFNERNLRTEFDTAKATSTATANVLRAVAGGAKFMEHRATMDTHTRPVHAALNGKVWRIDGADQSFRRFVAPLSWNCRCQSIFLDEANPADFITAEDAEKLLGSAEVERLTKDGFLQDRIATKALFTNRQNYLAGLPNPDKIAFGIDSLTFAEHGLSPWKDVNKSELNPYKATISSGKDALTDFVASAKDAIKVYTDYRGMPLFLQETELAAQTETAAGAEQYFTVADVVAAPDEVYFTQGDHLTNTYLKFYADNTVLEVEVRYSKDLPQSVQSWRQVPAAKIDAARRGLLIHKK